MSIIGLPVINSLAIFSKYLLDNNSVALSEFHKIKIIQCRQQQHLWMLIDLAALRKRKIYSHQSNQINRIVHDFCTTFSLNVAEENCELDFSPCGQSRVLCLLPFFQCRLGTIRLHFFICECHIEDTSTLTLNMQTAQVEERLWSSTGSTALCPRFPFTSVTFVISVLSVPNHKILWVIGELWANALAFYQGKKQQ